jgi:23S rRNA (cytidine1920-2'-O)/16S rRNA (cytidine1409-2'-O)-methyltransferase
VSRATTERPLRQRLDQLLVERGLAETRSRAQALILAGRVRVGEGDAARLDRKAGDLVGADATLGLTG